MCIYLLWNFCIFSCVSTEEVEVCNQMDFAFESDMEIYSISRNGNNILAVEKEAGRKMYQVLPQQYLVF